MPQPDQVAQQPLLPDGMDVPAQALDESVLSGDHDWILLPVTALGFKENVEEVISPRPDIDRYRIIAASNRTIARNLFSLLCRSTSLFRIPNTIFCSRTFARDREEAYYVDAMDRYLRGEPGELNVNDIPLLQRPLRSRMFCAFARKPGYRSELFERRRLRIWQPFDAPEDRDFEDAELCNAYPKIEDNVEQIYLPPVLAVPLPFVFFYYHKELRQAQIVPFTLGSEKIRRLKFCARKEYPILIMCMWWNEVYYGGRMYVMKPVTINILETECGQVPDIGGMPAQAIIAHMRMVAAIPSCHHNWMCFDDGCMEPSTFIWGIKYTGALDTSAPCRQRYYCSKMERKISTRKYGAPIVRGRSVMEERLSVPDLDKVRGLLNHIDENGWQAPGSLRVGDLLYNMLRQYRRTDSHVMNKQKDLDNMRWKLDSSDRELGYARSDLRSADAAVRDRDFRIADLERDLRCKDDQISDLEKSLRNGTRELEYARNEIHTLRSAPAGTTLSAPSTPRINGGRPRTPNTPRSPSYTPAYIPLQPTRPLLSSSQVRVPTGSCSYRPALGTSDGSNQRGSHRNQVDSGHRDGERRTDHSHPGSSAQTKTPRVRSGYPFHEMPRNVKHRRLNGDGEAGTGSSTTPVKDSGHDTVTDKDNPSSA